MKRKRLGKGLEALIPQVPDEETESRTESLAEIDVARIKPNPYQPRLDFDSVGLEELKKSIAENGMIQPVTVRETGDGFELIAGERRLRAVQELGYERVPAYIVDVDSEDSMLEMALVENIQREDLNALEVAKAYQQLQKEYGMTQEAIAVKVGKDRATVANFLRLLKLPRVIQDSLRKSEISMGHARALMGLPSAGEQTRIWRKSVKQAWSVRKLEEIVRELTTSGPVKKKVRSSQVSAQLTDVEDRLRSILGTRIKVTKKGEKGKIEISFFSDEDLNRILDILYQL
jgi:ParB family chromosome partitioning protein